MKLVNGWTQEEIQLLSQRTGCDEELILRFCQAVDKQLYLMLPTETKRATLHFHLRHAKEKQSTLESTTKQEPVSTPTKTSKAKNKKAKF